MSPKFCAGRTIEGGEVESINPAAEVATTGTLGASTEKPAADEWVAFDLWCGFVLMVACFVVAFFEDQVRGGGA